MRAIIARSYGGPDVLELADLPVPEPARAEVVVRVAAAGINPVDSVARRGFLRGLYDDGPWTWGWDIAGTVTATGPGVTAFEVGDEVFGMPRFPAQAGAYAEYVAAPAADLAAKPASLDFRQAAGLPLAGLTALQVADLAGVTAGQKVLITAAAGGVGHLAVQVAKARGAIVLGTARAANHDFLRSLGVDEPIDYTAIDAAAEITGLDAVFDHLDEPGLIASVRPGGTFIRLTHEVTDALAAEAAAKGIKATRHVVHPDGEGLARLAAQADAGQLTVRIDEVFPIEQAAIAHRRIESGRTRGKIVLEIA